MANNKKNQIFRMVKRMMLDSILLNGALFISLAILNTASSYYSGYFPALWRMMPIMTITCLSTFYFFGFYRVLWRYTTTSDLLRIVVAVLVASILTYLLSVIITAIIKERYFMLPRLSYMLFAFFAVFAIGASRVAYRIIRNKEIDIFHQSKRDNIRRAMIVGVGYMGTNVIRRMFRNQLGNITPVVALDSDPKKIGTYIDGVPVLSAEEDIEKLVSKYAVDEIIISINGQREGVKRLIERCIPTGCSIKRVSMMHEVKGDSQNKLSIHNIKINDLLEREEETLDLSAVASYVHNKTVLITGGGGSIGSELCRNLIALNVKRVVLFDISENYMYDLFAELRIEYGPIIAEKLFLRIGSVRDENRLSQVFSEFSPEIVLHAAAHKHVPLMEDSPTEAIKNNVVGTYLAAKTAAAYNVERFLLISTDKAVNPTNIMGASKRMAEMIVEAFDQSEKTEYVAVRFGNVLGSHGSVVPLFASQIAAGGPVTLTHPEIIRYFMTIPEAAKLVLKALAMANGGELFVLDMGKPVKIQTLAEHMIALYAPKDGANIEIKYVGLRPGEKLYEELLLSGEETGTTIDEKIFIARPEMFSMEEAETMLTQLRFAMNDQEKLRLMIKKYVPTFKDADEVNHARKAASL